MNAEIKKEQELRKSIATTYDKNMIIEAGAGGGKTSLVVENIVNRIATGSATPESLVVITFTKKAAEELRQRILGKLVEKRYAAAEGSDEKTRLEEAVKNYSRIQISTIHSYCFTLIKENALEANLPLDLVMLEQDEAKTVQSKFFEEWFKSLSYETRTKIREDIDNFNFKQKIKSAFLDICDKPGDTEFVYDKSVYVSNATKDSYENEVISQTEEVIRIVKSLQEENEKIAKANNKKATKMQVDYEKLITYDAGETDREKLIEIATKLTKSYKSNKTYTPYKKGLPLAEQFESQFDMDSWADATRKYGMYENCAIFHYALIARDEYRKQIEAASSGRAITNDRLLEEAYNLVKNSDKALKKTKDKITVLYLDEDQDTDRIQMSMIKKICGIEDTPSGDGVTLADPDAPNIVMVGDPKQSIYRFRGADLKQYEDVKKTFRDGGVADVSYLNINYRSNPKIVEWVNSEYEEKFNDMFGAGQYKPMLTPDRKIESNDEVLEGVFCFEKPIRGKDDAIANDYNQLCDVIEYLVKNPQIKILKKSGIDEQTGDAKYVAKNVEYKDIMVLTRTKKGTTYNYVRALCERGIPVVASGELPNSNERELRRLLALFTYLMYPKDRKNRMGAITALNKGITVDEETVKATIRRLETLKSDTSDMSPVATLGYLIHHVALFANSEENELDVLRMQSHLEQCFEKISSLGVTGKSAVCESLTGYINGVTDRELSLSNEENAVVLMNAHKAKGLENKVVIVAGRKMLKAISATTLTDKNKFYPVISSEGEFAVNYALYSGEKVKEAKNEGENERTRLEYVTATRAGEVLIFLDQIGEKAPWFKSYKWDDVPRLQPAVEEYKKSNPGGSGDGEAEYADYENPWSVEITGEQKVPVVQTVNPSMLEIKSSVKREANSEQGREKFSAPDNIFGNVMHRAFEILVKEYIRQGKAKSEITEEVIKGISALAIMENSEDIFRSVDAADENSEAEKYFRETGKQLAGFLDSVLYSKVRSAKACYTEYSFNTELDVADVKIFSEKLYNRIADVKPNDSGTPEKPAKHYWMNGKADLILENEDGTVEIWDYKTDRRGILTPEQFDEYLNECYDNQQLLYEYAVHKLFGTDKAKISHHFYHMYMNE